MTFIIRSLNDKFNLQLNIQSSFNVALSLFMYSKVYLLFKE